MFDKTINYNINNIGNEYTSHSIHVEKKILWCFLTAKEDLFRKRYSTVI